MVEYKTTHLFVANWTTVEIILLFLKKYEDICNILWHKEYATNIFILLKKISENILKVSLDPETDASQLQDYVYIGKSL